MKVIRDFCMSQNEATYSLKPDEAVRRYQHAVANQQSIEGLDEIRRGMPSRFESDVVERLQSGQWRLFDEREASVFDWDVYEGWAKEQRQDTQAKVAAQPIEAQRQIGGFALCVARFYRAQPLRSRECSHGLGEEAETAITNEWGEVRCLHSSHDDQMKVWVRY